MNTTNDIRLTFGTDFAQSLVLRIPRADTEITAAEAIEAMDAIISTNALMGREGRAISRQMARLFTTTRTPFAITN